MLNIIKEKVLLVGDAHLAVLSLNPENAAEEIKKIIRDYQMMMLSFGWHNDEVEFYNECRTNVVDFKYACDKNFMDILLLRYASIQQEFSPNKQAKDIVTSVILRATNDKLLHILENIQNEIYGYRYCYAISVVRIKIWLSMERLVVLFNYLEILRGYLYKV